MPGYGRLEREPPANRKPPPQAESYSRSWSARSTPPQAAAAVPFYPPSVIEAPPDYQRPQWHRRGLLPRP
jgi:hypothetical protein